MTANQMNSIWPPPTRSGPQYSASNTWPPILQAYLDDNTFAQTRQREVGR